jgi:hypothetical protein
VVHFFQHVVGEPVIGKEVLSRRTNEYQAWMETFANNHAIAIEWAQPKVRKEDYVRPALRRMERAGQHGVYFILKSMEQGQTFHSMIPRFATTDPNYRIMDRQRSRFTHYYFYVRDETLGPMMMRVASFFPFQATYYLNGHNFIEKELDREKVSFRKNDNAFLAVSDPEALQSSGGPPHLRSHPQEARVLDLILGPKFSKRERAAMNLRRFYAVSHQLIPTLEYRIFQSTVKPSRLHRWRASDVRLCLSIAMPQSTTNASPMFRVSSALRIKPIPPDYHTSGSASTKKCRRLRLFPEGSTYEQFRARSGLC